MRQLNTKPRPGPGPRPAIRRWGVLPEVVAFLTQRSRDSCRRLILSLQARHHVRALDDHLLRDDTVQTTRNI